MCLLPAVHAGWDIPSRVHPSVGFAVVCIADTDRGQRKLRGLRSLLIPHAPEHDCISIYMTITDSSCAPPLCGTGQGVVASGPVPLWQLGRRVMLRVQLQGSLCRCACGSGQQHFICMKPRSNEASVFDS